MTYQIDARSIGRPIVSSGSRQRPSVVVSLITTGLLAVAWLRYFLPQLLLVLRFPRERFVSSAEVPVLPEAESLGQILTALLVLGGLALCILGLGRFSESRLAPIVCFLAPLVELTFSDYLNSDSPDLVSSAAYLTCAVGLWLTRPSLRSGWIIAVLTAGLSLFSITLAVSGSARGVVADTGVQEGAGLTPFPNLLAGPFLQANLLGLALAIGFPFIWLVRRLAVRVVLMGVVLVALVWTASQTAEVTVVAGLAVVAARRLSGDRHRPGLSVKIVALIGVALLVATPFLVSDPNAFTGRGKIWMAALGHVPESLWFGHGTDWFSVYVKQVNDIGRFGFHGHNLLVHTLVTGGVVGVIAVTLLFYSGWVAASRAWMSTYVPVAFVVSCFYLYWLEGSLRLPRGDAAILWLPLALVVFSMEGDEHSGSPDGREPELVLPGLPSTTTNV